MQKNFYLLKMITETKIINIVKQYDLQFISKPKDPCVNVCGFKISKKPVDGISSLSWCKHMSCNAS